MTKQHKPPFARTRGVLIPARIDWKLGQDVKWKGSADTSSRTSYVNLPPVHIGQDINDVVTPGFKEKQANGEIINNPMQRRVGDFGFQPYSGTVKHAYVKNPSAASDGQPIVVYDVVENFAPDASSNYFPTISVPDLQIIRQQAINEAFAASHQRDILLNVDLAEIGKTTSMLHNDLARLENLVKGVPLTKKLKRLKRGKSAKAYVAKSPYGKLSDASGLWLEYHYGVVPLMLSIEGLMKVLDDQVKPERQTFRGFGSYSDVLFGEKLNFEGGSASHSPYPMNRVVRAFRSLDYRSRARGGIITTYKPSTRERLGMSARDLPSTAYELIPYSFVLDWVYDLGTAMEAMIPIPGFSALASWVTTEVTEVDTFALEYTYGEQEDSVWKVIYPAYSASLFTTKFQKIRTPGVSPGLPNLDLRFKSITHAISGFALAVSRAKGRLGKRI